MKFDYHYFLDKSGFVDKYNIDLGMNRLLSKGIKNVFKKTQNPLKDVKILEKESRNISDSFIALILCGGKAVRFNGLFKAVFEIPNAIKTKENLSFLELNIQQIISYEKEYKVSIPIIIYDDFATRDPIKKLLRSKQYFGKNKSDFIHVMQTSWFRYVPSKSMLDKYSLSDKVTSDQLVSLPQDPEIYKSKKLIDSVVGTGHFVFNSLISSYKFKKLIKSRSDISKIVISNCDNLGKKYYPELVKGDGLNYPIVTDRNIDERMDGIYTLDNSVRIIPYFKEQKKNSSLGFTGTICITIDSLLNIYNFRSRRQYFNSDSPVHPLNNTYTPIIKLIRSLSGNIITLHFESVLSDISNFLELKPVYMDRDLCFFPFKTIEDVNEKYVGTWRKSVIKNKYIIYK